MMNIPSLIESALSHKRHLEDAYTEGKGSMQHILDSVMLCTDEDEPRFREIIDEWILFHTAYYDNTNLLTK